jgi:hypothetical protein
MNRTLLLKLLYVAVAAFLCSAAWVAVTLAFPDEKVPALVGVGLMLLVPGRLQGVFFRTLFRGRRLLDRGRPREALPHLHASTTQVLPGQAHNVAAKAVAPVLHEQFS